MTVEDGNHECAEQLSTEDVAKLREIHAWLSEIMPTFRRAAKLMDNSVAVRIREAMKKR